jgi:hypothetical protein
VIDWPAREWGIILGDAVHCLRSALDHLVYGLAGDPGGRTQFPIFTKKKDWVTRAPAMYWSVLEPLVAIIDDAQPYHDGEVAADHPLAILRTLSNLDKHRAIPAVALVPYNNEATVERVVGIAEWGKVRFPKGRPYEKGTVIAECKIVPDDSGLEPEMHVKVKSTFDVGFGRIAGAPSIDFMPVVPTLKRVGMFIVENVVNRATTIWNMIVEEAARMETEGIVLDTANLPK